jgi:hypothetical protein
MAKVIKDIKISKNNIQKNFNAFLNNHFNNYNYTQNNYIYNYIAILLDVYK